MPIAVDQSDVLTEIRLDGTVDISMAAELKTHLLEALSAGRELRLNLAAVADVDVTWVQLAWAAAREAKRAGTKFSFSGPVPEKVGTALSDAGFKAFPCSSQGE